MLTDEGKQPRIKRYKIGQQEIVQADCLRVLKRMPSHSVDVVVTSPPYNIGIPYRHYPDCKTESEYLEWIFAIAHQIRRIIKPKGSFFFNISGSSIHPWLPFELMVRLRALFVLQNHIVWVKSISIGEESFGHFKPLNSQRYLHHGHEHIFHLTCDGSVQLNRLGIGVPYKDKSNIVRRGHKYDKRCRGNTWFIPYPTVQKRSEKFDHPALFPVALPEYCIRLHRRENTYENVPENLHVLDPFMGTGTTLLAAQNLRCTGVGIEIDKNYVSIACKRLREMFCEMS